MITGADVEQFRRDGYIVVPDVLPPQVLDLMRREISEIAAGAAGLTAFTALR